MSFNKLREILKAIYSVSSFLLFLRRPSSSFLPIFIFCVVQAEIDRPCALCVLLRSLCDRINQMGEIGYYLASFEAAVTHIQEIDLSEDAGSPMQSFLSVNLDNA